MGGWVGLCVCVCVCFWADWRAGGLVGGAYSIRPIAGATPPTLSPPPPYNTQVLGKLGLDPPPDRPTVAALADRFGGMAGVEYIRLVSWLCGMPSKKVHT